MRIEDLKKPKKSYKIVCLVTAILFIVLIFAGILFGDTNPSKTIAYHALIAEGKDQEGEYVSLDITDIPYIFAEEEYDTYSNLYYLVFDENNYMYIVRLTDDTYNEIEEMYEKDSENFKYHLEGYIYDIVPELKDLAISTYNEWVKEEYHLTEENFESYVGTTYLDEEKNPTGVVASVCFAIAMIDGIFFIVFFICYLMMLFRGKKEIKKWNVDELDMELMNCDTEKYKKENVYLTNHYIISNDLGLRVLRYDDLVWVYQEKIKQRGILVNIVLIVYTKDKKRYQIASNLKNEERLIEIMGQLKEKNPNLLIGYTKENQQQYREFKKGK